MGGLSLNMGLGGSVFTPGYGGASTPAAAGASPQGPTTVGQKAFGIVTGSPGGYGAAHVAGMIIYWGAQHFLGIGNTGKSKSP